MTKRIEISNLRNISTLTFELPSPGVFLLSGENGAGKSSLLACLLRLGDRNAFPKYFRTSRQSRLVDQFEGAQVSYHLNGESVTYQYSGERWVPSPKKNSALLDRFGYGAVLHIGADANRIEPRPEDVRYRRVRSASDDIVAAANSIFETERFDDLRTINVRRGTGSQAFLLAEAPNPNGHRRYFSERNFSLGEICVLKLLREVQQCDNGTLLLIDELELALHPRAQVGLVRYLETVAASKGLTVIFSTHSPTLIRSVARDKVLFLSKEGASVRCIRGCYPAFALGQISFADEISPDVVIYVEDEAAKNVVSALASELISDSFADAPKPTVVTVPIGPFRNVVQFLSRAVGLLPPTTRQYALLDKDVETESVGQWTTAGNHEILAEFERVKDRLRYLPWTPEVGICDFLVDGAAKKAELRAFFGDQRIGIPTTEMSSIGAMTGASQRRAAKKAIRDFVSYVSQLRIWEERKTSESLSQFFVKGVLSGPDASAIKELILPLLRG